MDTFFSFFIAFFESLNTYSTANGLGEHLRGLDINCGDYINQSKYNLVIIWMLVINCVVMLNYYYGIFNRVNFTKRLAWIVNILVAAIITFLIAFFQAYNDYSIGNFCRDLKITLQDCMGFGLSVAIVSIIWSLFFSILIKWKSNNNKKIPF